MPSLVVDDASTMPSNGQPSAASSSDTLETPKTNRVAATNGVVDGKDEETTKQATKTEEPEDTEPCAVGMTTGLKNLYSGKEDKRGRYQWQDTIPDDLGVVVENTKTAKWALLVRHVKVYNDPTKVLAIHSIVVQSPPLKRLLAGVLRNYPGITADLNRLEFSQRFEPLIHRWTELQAAISKIGTSTEEERTTKEHAQLFLDILVKEFKDLIDTSQDMRNKRVMTYEHLWTLFQPGSIVFTRQDGQETALQLQSTRYGQDADGNPCFWVIGRYVDWDGTAFGTNQININIPIYAGTRPIHSLRIFPLEYHPAAEAVKEKLIQRGSKVEELAGVNYKAYEGMAWRMGQFGVKDKHHVKGRIVIDTYGWNRFEPSHAIYTTHLGTKEPISDSDESDEETDSQPPSPGEDDAESEQDDFEPAYDEYGNDGMPLDGHFADEEQAAKRPSLTSEQKLICTPLLRGYSLKDKLWLNFFVNSVKEIEWQKDAFDRLVLPKNQKELILGFTESQQKHREAFDDVIEGKGRGMIILLCGPPGVGKTLTAESVAEEMKVPLFTMSAGDLGLDPRRIEAKLNDMLEMCTRWHSVLLLDEADVFLEERSLHELERNKLVSIFLRVLEYFEGTMFLTTNRLSAFDPAFASRIHISLNYKELSVASRRTVWKNFLDASPQEHEITKEELDELSRLNMNGRQIKNILKIARLLATRKDAKLNREHILTTLEVTQHLHNESQVTEGTRGTLYS